MNPEVDALLAKESKWQTEMEALRAILLDCGLTEEIKWKKPCYIFQKANLVILYSLKDCCALGFMKGPILQDPENILLKPGENSQSGKWAKFTSLEQIEQLKPTIKAYIYEAIQAEKAGIKIDFSKNKTVVYPQELVAILDKDADFKEAFEALTPGRKRGYNLFFTAAKQSQTRTDRIEKYRDRILKGKGINDCVCGMSKRMPNCDGSHKYI